MAALADMLHVADLPQPKKRLVETAEQSSGSRAIDLARSTTQQLSDRVTKLIGEMTDKTSELFRSLVAKRTAPYDVFHRAILRHTAESQKRQPRSKKSKPRLGKARRAVAVRRQRRA